MPMSRSSKRVAALVAATLAAGGLAACSSSSGGLRRPPRRGHGHQTVRRLTSGGTLNVVATSRPRPPGHRAGVLHRGLRARAHLRPAARQLPDVPYSATTGAGLDHGHHAGRRRRDRGADRRQRRHHRRRQGVHLPHQAGRRLEHHPGPPGDRRRLHPRVQGVLQPGQPGRQPRVLHQRRSPACRRTPTRRPPTSPTPRRTRRRPRTSPTSRTRTTSPASRRSTARRCSSR